jgi:hypothetical protein
MILFREGVGVLLPPTRGSSRCIIWKHPLLKQQHQFCRKPFNEHSCHAQFQFAKWYQRRRLKSKSVQTTDAKGEQYVTQHLYSSFRVVIHLDDPLFGGSNTPPSLKRIIQLYGSCEVLLQLGIRCPL